MIHYITGGARSGKSDFAQKLAERLSDQPIYLATARNWDNDFNERIEKHISDRGDNWTTVEEEKNVGRHEFGKSVVVVDCVTLWLTNFFVDNKQDIDECLELFKNEIDLLREKNETTYIIISNEIGMGLHADTESGRKFVDLQGWANQYLAEQSDNATLMVSGIPMNLK